MSEAELARCAEDLRQEVLNQAEIEGEEALLRDAFTQVAIDILVAAGELDDGHVSFHQGHGIEVAGYNLAEDGILDLFATIHVGVVPPDKVTKAEIDTAFKRLISFFRKSLKNYHLTLEEASQGFDLAQQISEVAPQLEHVRLYCLTDGIAPAYEREAEEVEGLRVTFSVWDIARLCRASAAGRKQEPIEIDVEAIFGGPIPCLAAPSVDGVYKAYLAVIPARLLSDLYDQYRDRLLELNVRSFLQAKGKVNQGIRRTINAEPEKFFAYNNGITATAERLELCGLPGGGMGIKGIRNLQIVNGGQTTASIHYAARKDKADVGGIAVQAKIIVVPEAIVQEIVPLVARFSNTQNKVQEADFAANDSYHVGLETLSRTTWAPSPAGTNRQTRWFYERARGQYQQAMSQAGTPARQRAFKAENPLQQKITKTDLAKFENTWDQLPNIVSLGAQKNFREFTLRLAMEEVKPDETTFHRVVAKAILFKRAERIIGAMGFGGYRANIVTYALALLSHRTGRRLDLDAIWNAQDITDATGESIEDLARQVFPVLSSPPGGGNVTEWCKKAACWKAVCDLPGRVPASLVTELSQTGVGRRPPALSGSDPGETEDSQAIAKAEQVPPDVWMRVSAWAKETDSLQPWQRGLAYSLGRLLGRGRHPTLKQAVQGLKLLEMAERQGFRPEDDAA